ncbi:MAG: hypothetical protein KME03_07690 [Aphanocapsa lilacina HA4352-LM1]|nr:hypothetical protein [Aphanocapsa lilacina HA4352-LM1]
MKSFEKIADEQGWSSEIQVRILLKYIEKQARPEDFENFLLDQVDREDATDHIGA